MFGKKLGDLFAGFEDRGNLLTGDVQAGFALLPGDAEREGRAAGGLSLDRYHECGVAIADIPAGPLIVFQARRFAQVVGCIESTVFGAATSRAPPLMRNAEADREIEGGPIGPRLSARHNRESVGQIHAYWFV